MQRHYLTALLLGCCWGLTAPARADSIDSLLHRTVPTAYDIRNNAEQLIPQYYARGASDSAALVVAAWREYSGADEVDPRIVVLLALARGTYGDSLIDTAMFKRVAYVQRSYGDGYLGPDRWGYGGRSLGGVRETYHNFVVRLADSLAAATDPASTEHLVCRYYGGHFDECYRRLRTDPAFATSPLKAFYDRQIAYLLRQPQVRIALSAGAWVPSGNLTRLGSHPELGLLRGWKRRRITADLFMNFRFIDARNDYQVRQADSLYANNSFVCGHIGLDLGLEVFRSPGHEVDLYAGIGWEGFQAISKEQSAIGKQVSIDALNVNPGVEYRYYYDRFKVRYVGARVRYHIVDYNRDAALATDLSGGAASIDLVWGVSGNWFSNDELRALRRY